jgi:hypothetical protein
MAIHAGKHGDNPARRRIGADRRYSREVETMLDEKTRQMISEKAADIMAEIRDSWLYGEQIDLMDPDQILVAAYLVGEKAEYKRRDRMAELLTE